jgi:rhodanese-related sulfurtransferase
MTTLISREELWEAIDAGAVTVVDALPESYYAQQHLPGALNLVEQDVTERAAELLPDRTAAVVTYCSNPACGNSQAVASRLEQLGYRNVRKYREGIQDWVAAELPTESGLPATAEVAGLAASPAETSVAPPGRPPPESRLDS